MSSLTKGVSKLIRSGWHVGTIRLVRDTEDGFPIEIQYVPGDVGSDDWEPYSVSDEETEEAGGNVPRFKTERQAMRYANKRAKELGGWEDW